MASAIIPQIPPSYTYLSHASYRLVLVKTKRAKNANAEILWGAGGGEPTKVLKAYIPVWNTSLSSYFVLKYFN